MTAYRAELPPQGEPEIGQELIRVRYDDGRTEELHLHDYARLYGVPGLYEQIVVERLGYRSPWEIAAMLAAAVDRLGREREQTRVIDLAAGNGLSGEALAEQGLRPVLGTDIVAEAREAALRDRPHVYDSYLTLDLLSLTPEQQQAIAALYANALACVAPVGTASQQLPPLALAAVTRLLAPDSLVAYMHDPALRLDDPVTPELFGAGVIAAPLERRHFLHRYRVGGRRYEMDAVVWRIRRRPTAGA